MIKKRQLCSYASFFVLSSLYRMMQHFQTHARIWHAIQQKICCTHTNYWHWFRHLNVSRGWAQRVPKTEWRSVCLKLCLCLLDIHIVRATLKHVPLQILKPLQAHRQLSLLWVEKNGKMDRRRGNIIFHHLWLTLQKCETYFLGWL